MSATSHAVHRDDFGAKLGMWLFLVSEILLFGGLFIAYSYMRAQYPLEFHHGGQELNVPIGVANTIILLTSSLTVVLAIATMKRGEALKSKLFLGFTVLCGAAFLANKGFEWSVKIHHGIYPDSPVLAGFPHGEQVFFGLYYTMTGLHGLHVLAGMGLLSWILVRMVRGKVTPENTVLLENGGLYWHLVDVIWIYLLPLFYLPA